MLHWQLFSVVIPTYILFLIALGTKGVGELALLCASFTAFGAYVEDGYTEKRITVAV
jgi:hypothetical protein